MRVFLRGGYECLLVLWNDMAGPASTPSGGQAAGCTITLPHHQYTYPVRIHLLNYSQTTSLPYELDGEGRVVIRDVVIDEAPVIIRLVAEKQAFAGQP